MQKIPYDCTESIKIFGTDLHFENYQQNKLSFGVFCSYLDGCGKIWQAGLVFPNLYEANLR